MKLKSIKIFEQDENIFTSNGLGIVYPSSCVIKRNLPEMTYSLELECIIDNNGKWKLFETGRIIVAKNQPFRIGIIEHDPISRTMKVYAEHIFFDLQNNFIEDTNIVDKNGSMAINQLLSHTVEPHNFVGTSDITNVNSSRCVRKQVLTALLGDQDNSFINRWGGELDIDGFTFKINKQIGSDKGYKIKYGKNLTGLNYKTNMNLNKMATKIRPVGFDGISLNEKYVISSKINDYPMPIIREIKYENVKWKGSPNFETREDDDSFIYENLSDAQDKLRELAQKEFENGIDLLDATLDVDFIELSKTEEYKDYKILETVEIGDTVSLEYSPLGISTKRRCIEYELDVLTDRYNSIVLGDCEPNFFNETNKIVSAVADAVVSGKLEITGGIPDKKIQEIIGDMTEIMTNYLTGYVIITNNEILIMDTDDKETAQNVWRFNMGGIAHSSTGYNGTYTVGMTMDGHINGRIISANTIMGESMVANTVTARELAVELNKKIEDAQTKEQVEQIFNVGEGQLKSFISETYETKTEVTQKINDLSTDVDGKLNDKADKSTTYTKQEVNTQISQAQSNILLGVSETYETKTEVTNKLNDLSDNFDGKLSDTIVKMDVMYYLSTSTENLSGGTWSSVAPKWEDGKYMWSKTITTFKNGTTKESTPTCLSGATGKNGTSITSSDVEYYLSNSSTSLSGGSWSTTAPTWENGKYMWSRVKTTFSSGVTSQSEPVCITGQKGDNGTNGADGRGISSITEEYYLSNSKTTQSGGSWQTTAPTWSSGKYLWTRSKIVYTNPTSTVYTTPICDNSWEAVNEIQVGGRNLYINTKVINKSDWGNNGGWSTSETYNGFTIFKRVGAWMGLYQNIAYEVGQIYTLSAYVKGSNEAKLNFYFNGTGSTQATSFGSNNKYIVPSNWTRVWVTFKVVGEDFIQPRFENPVDGATLEIYAFKMEKGNKATDWSPAPEDLLATIKEEQTALSTNIYNELNSVNSVLMDIGNTNKITPQIKLNLKNMFNMANVTNDKLNSLYDTVGILDAEPFKDDKDTAFNNLKNQMNSLFSNITETTVKAISEIYDLFNDFYVTSTNLEKVLNHFAQEKLNYTYANLEMLKDSVDIAVGRVDTIEGHVEEINKHFTFNTDGLTIYSTDNTATSNVSLNLDNDQMSFKDGDSVVAYISSNKLNIENAEVKNEFIIGKFAWKPSPKGGLMLVKRSDS